VQRAPGIPCALYWAEDLCKTRAHRAAGLRTRIRNCIRCLKIESVLSHQTNDKVQSFGGTPAPDRLRVRRCLRFRRIANLARARHRGDVRPDAVLEGRAKAATDLLLTVFAVTLV
jgi:hypothetical protein